MSITPRRRRSLPLALLLAGALLGAQLLGGWHRIAHAPSSAASSLPVAATALGVEQPSAFGHASGGADCGLFDQLLVAAAFVSAAPPALPVQLPAIEALTTLGIDVRATAWQLPAARAPPLGHSA